MAVALRGATASGANDGPSQTSSRATNVPTGSAADDIAILISEIWRNGTTPTVTFPAGFTQFLDLSIPIPSNGTLYLRMAWKRLTGADAGTYTATYSATVWNLLHCVTVSGAALTGDPIEATNSATATSTTVPSTSVTTVTEPFLLHSLSTFNDATQTPPTNFTEDLDGTVLHTNHRIPATTGTHTVTGATISANTQMVVGLVAVKAETGGGSTVAGTLAGSLPALTASVTGSARVSGTAAGALPAIVSSLSGSVRVSGIQTGTLSALTGSFTGTAHASSTLSATLPGITGAFTATVRATGSLAATLPAITGALSGNVSTPGAPVTGTLSAALPAIQGALSGDLTISATVTGHIPALTASAAAAARVAATMSGTLPTVVAALTGTAGPPAAYSPLTDPVSVVRPNPATATSRENAATAVIRVNSAEAAS